MKTKDHEPELWLLLDDYERRPRRRLTPPPKSLSASPISANGVPSGKGAELHLLLTEYSDRARRWLQSFEPSKTPVPLPDGETPPALRLLVSDFEPGRRYWEEAAKHPARTAREPTDRPADGVAIDLELDWPRFSLEPSVKYARLGSFAAHLAVLALIASVPPGIRGPQATGQGDGPHQITLLSPPPTFLSGLRDIEPLPAPPIEEFKGLPEVEQPLLEVPVVPAPEIKEDPEQPGLPDVPEPTEEPGPPAAEKPPAEEPKFTTPAARSPVPGEFRPGRSRRQNPKAELLPMPRAPSSPEKPKLALEDPGASAPGRSGPLQFGSLGLNTTTDDLIEGSLRQVARGNVGRQAVGDTPGAGGFGGSSLPPSPGNTGSALELLSDPKGVDFRPYLMRILSSVRRNWFAVLPESARLGMTRGLVSLQFIIVREGNVSKLVIAKSSGIPSLDRAAVAGISASLPFPPLPIEYPGREVRLQFTFRYNLKNR